MFDADPASEKSSTLPAVTVRDTTGRRFDRPVSTGSALDMTPMQTPASVESVDRDSLDGRGDLQLVDAITRTTGVTSLGHPGNSGSSLSMRGFTDTTSVMRLYDGMRQYGGVGLSFPFDTWAVDRIEVLRGPASVIHGDGAIGGVINVIPRKPRPGPVRHEIRTMVGNRGQRGLALDSSGSLGERVSYRFDASTDRSDGWVDRGRSSHLTFTGAMRFDVTPALNVTLTHSQGRQKPMQYFGSPMVDGRPLPSLARRNYNVADSHIEYRDRWTDAFVQWSPNDSVVMRSRVYHIRSHRDWRNAETYRYDAATGLIDRSDNTQIAHDQTQIGITADVTVSGTVAGRLNRFSLGFDANDSSLQHTNNTYSGSSGPVDPFDPVPGLFSSDAPFIPRFRNRARQRAFFAEDRIELTDAWSVVGGLRIDRATLARADLVSGTQAFERRYSSTGWRLGAVYRWNADRSVYLQFARAADPVSSLLLLSPANAAFDGPTGRQWEVGLRQSLRDGQADWTLAAYAITKKNLVTRDPSDPSRQLQVGQRSSLGLESTLSAALTPSLRIDANVAWLRARYDDFTERQGAAAVSRSGNVPPDVPRRVANVWIGWHFRPGWTASGGVRHVGRRYADAANSLVIPSYTTTDLALKWQVAPATALTLRGSNVFDRRHYTTAYYTTTQWFVGEGRSVTLTMSHRF